MTFNLKAEGNTLSGTVTTRRGEMAISDGKVEGDSISFTQSFEGPNGTMKFLYKGTVSGNEIKFTRQREGGQGRGQEFTAKKVS